MLYPLLHTPFTPSHKPNALRLTPNALSLAPYALCLTPYPLPLTPYSLRLIPYALSKVKHILLLLLFLVVGASAALAQLHPIQVNLIAPPTLPGSISGLYQGNGLKATLILLDRYQTSIDVGIGFTVKGNGVTIEKRPDYLGETPTLLYATPKVLGEDFFASLLQQGISYNGPNRDAFDSKGTLTSGRYEVSLWAYDLNHPSVRISNLARVYLWIQKSAPPTLIAPLDKAIVYAIPQQFNWSVTMAFNGLTTPRYKFMLYELNDPNRNPADEVMSSEPFYQEEVAAPSFSYLTYHPQLIRGKRYAWRVQAVAYDQSQQEVPLFNNDGYTAIRSFSYGQDATASLKKLLALDAKSKNPYTIEVKVKPDTIGKTDTPDGLKIEYRRCGEQEWQEQEVDDDVTTIAKLTPNTEYEVRGYARMGALYGDAGPVVKARTQAPPEVKCGTTFSFKPDASTKLGSLAVGDIVTANQIPFTITKLDSNDPPYKGMAYAGISFFGGKKLSFKLVNATFNSKYELTGGTITADTIGINRYIANKMTEQAQKEANSNEKKGDILANENTVKVDGDIKDVTSIKVDNTDKEHPKVVVTTTDGKEQIIPFKGETITLADKTGEVYTASADGKVNNIGMYDGAASGVGGMASTPQAKPKNLYGTDLLVRFTPDAKQQYGFDNPALGHDYWKEKYDTTIVAGRTEVVPVKLVAAGASDKVSVVVLGEAADKNGENLIFKTSTGMRYAATPGDKEGTLQLSLVGGAPDSRQELTAWLKKGDSTFAVGRLSIDAYQSISRRVVVVPVGDATFTQAAELARGLNDIYNQAAVKWDATVADATLPMPEGVGESIKVDKSLLSAYSAGMRKIRSAFTGTSTYQRLGDDDIYYIFLTTLPMQGEDDSSPFDGYMPYGKPFGFVRSAGMEPQKLAWVVAHELGHGAFQLQHVWLPDSRNMGGTWYKESTPNLMSYTQTPELFRWQWQDIHNPVGHSNILADAKDLGAIESIAENSEMLEYTSLDGFNAQKDDEPKFIFYYTPAGNLFALPRNVKKVSFFTTTSFNEPVARGSLTAFESNGILYVAHYYKKSGYWYFDGYYPKGSNNWREKKMSLLTESDINYIRSEGKSSSSNKTYSIALGVSLGENATVRLTLKEIASKLLVPKSFVNVGTFTVVTFAANIVGELFASPSYPAFGDGILTPTLPMVGDGTEYTVAIPDAIPHTLPVTNNGVCPPEGSCGVYVIYGLKGKELFVAKYGMTCQENMKTDPNYNPRPWCQVRRLNRELAEKLIDPFVKEGNPQAEEAEFNKNKAGDKGVLWYKFAWVIRGVDKTSALLCEKAMVAKYLIDKKGVLPPKQYLPNFGIKSNLENGLDNCEKFIDLFKKNLFK
jgi:hypothetical protein